MKSSESEISFQSKVMIKKAAENCRDSYVDEKRVVSNQENITIPKFDKTNWWLESISCQNFTTISIILSDKWAVKEHYGRAGSLFQTIELVRK